MISSTQNFLKLLRKGMITTVNFLSRHRRQFNGGTAEGMMEYYVFWCHR